MSHKLRCQDFGSVIGDCDEPPARVIVGTAEEVVHALVRDDLPEDEEAAQVIQLAEGIVEDAELCACLDDRDHTGETSLFKSYLCPAHFDAWMDEIVEANCNQMRDEAVQSVAAALGRPLTAVEESIVWDAFDLIGPDETDRYLGLLGLSATDPGIL